MKTKDIQSRKNTKLRRPYETPEVLEYGSLEYLASGGDFTGDDDDGMW